MENGRAKRKAAAIQAFAELKSMTIHHERGDSIELYSPELEPQFAKKAEAAMKRGAAVSRNGVREWIHFEELHPEIWHSDGNRTKHNVVRYKKDDKTGVITHTIDKVVWRNYAS